MKNSFFTFWSKISYEHLFVHSFVHKFVEGHVPWVWLRMPQNVGGLMLAVVLINFVPVPISYFAERYISKPIETWGLAFCGVTPTVMTP